MTAPSCAKTTQYRLSTGANAATVILNENFESGFGVFTPSGNVDIGTGASYQACCGTDPSNPNKFVAFGDGNDASGSIMATSFNTIAGRAYTLTFDYGALGSGTDPLFVTVGGATTTFFPVANNNLNTTFQMASIMFTGTGPSSQLRFQSGGVNNVDAILDNVKVTSAVPEPATWAMMIGGFGMVGGAMRRRRSVKPARALA